LNGGRGVEKCGLLPVKKRMEETIPQTVIEKLNGLLKIFLGDILLKQNLK
jgi:hypothetical protein